MAYEKEEIFYDTTVVTDVKRKVTKNIRIDFDAQTSETYYGSWKPSTTQDILGGGNARTKQVLNFPTSVVTANGYTMSATGNQVLITNQQTALISFNFASTVLILANRLLGAAQLQYSTDGETWTDIQGTLIYNYNRGIQTSGGAAAFGSIYEGAGSISILHDFAANSYLRARFWIEGRSNSSSGLRTEIEGCRLNIKSMPTLTTKSTNDYLSNSKSPTVFDVDSGTTIIDGNSYSNNLIPKHAFMIAPFNLKLSNLTGYINFVNGSNSSFTISIFKKETSISNTNDKPVTLLYTQTHVLGSDDFNDNTCVLLDTITNSAVFRNTIQISEGEGLFCTIKKHSGSSSAATVFANFEVVFEEVNPDFTSIGAIDNGITKEELTLPALCYANQIIEKVCK
tara:strand:- start:19358 stop:20548 length:1191 start_codon:yes stop_codon:yes gene_type:complete